MHISDALARFRAGLPIHNAISPLFELQTQS
jgi:hypothetical protein